MDLFGSIFSVRNIQYSKILASFLATISAICLITNPRKISLSLPLYPRIQFPSPTNNTSMSKTVTLTVTTTSHVTNITDF